MKILSPFQNTWLRYKKLVINNLKADHKGSNQNLKNWQDRLFATLILYLIPMSLVALVPCIIVELKVGHPYIAVFDVLAIAAVVAFLLNKRISLMTRRVILITIALAFSFTSTIYFGYFTIGAIYLFGISIFISYQFSKAYAYVSVLINFIIFIITGLSIYYRTIWMPVQIPLEQFTLFTSNLLFLNIIMVVIIRQTLVNLDRSVLKESILHKVLKKEIAATDQLNMKLLESEAHYKTLFFLSPLPKWIYDIESMEIQQVNMAAISASGYTEEELLSMSVVDLTQIDADDTSSVSTVKKLTKKDGNHSFIELKWSDLLFNGRPSRLVIAADITERVNHLEEIEKQNEKLREISFMQAHIIRSPLTKIMALSDLITKEYEQLQNEPLFMYLDKSAQELDGVIREIIRHSEQFPDKGTNSADAI